MSARGGPCPLADQGLDSPEGGRSRPADGFAEGRAGATAGRGRSGRLTRTPACPGPGPGEPRSPAERSCAGRASRGPGSASRPASRRERRPRQELRRAAAPRAPGAGRSLRASLILGPRPGGLSGILCGGRFHSADLEPFAEGDGELRPSLDPLLWRPFPVCGRAVQHEVWQFRRRLVRGEGARGPERPGGAWSSGPRWRSWCRRSGARPRGRRRKGSPDPSSAARPARRRGTSRLRTRLRRRPRPRARPRRPRAR